MAYQHWSYDTLHRLCMEAFQKFGFTEAEADIIQDVLLTADLYGIESHGMQRMVRYHKCIEKGMIDVHAKPEVVFETPISAVIDAHEAMGQLVSHKAMEMAIEKAKTTGVGIVSVRNSNHYGIAGYYAKMACKEGLMGFSCTNSEAIMVPTFARKAMLGSNPIACAFPVAQYLIQHHRERVLPLPLQHGTLLLSKPYRFQVFVFGLCHRHFDSSKILI